MRALLLLIGVLDGTAQNAGLAIREGRSGAGASRRIASVSPLATTPAMWLAFPAMYARAPTTSASRYASALCILGLSVRSIVSLNVWAVTGWFEPGEN